MTDDDSRPERSAPGRDASDDPEGSSDESLSSLFPPEPGLPPVVDDSAVEELARLFAGDASLRSSAPPPSPPRPSPPSTQSQAVGAIFAEGADAAAADADDDAGPHTDDVGREPGEADVHEPVDIREPGEAERTGAVVEPASGLGPDEPVVLDEPAVAGWAAFLAAPRTEAGLPSRPSEPLLTEQSTGGVAAESVAEGSTGEVAAESVADSERPTADVDEPVPDDARNLDPLVLDDEGHASLTTGNRWWRLGYPAMLVLLALAVPALVWFGSEIIFSSTEGTLMRSVDDPAEPGFEAFAEPTPTMLVAQVDPDGQLGAAVVLTLTGQTSGGVVIVPPDTVVEGDDGQPITLRGVFAEGGEASLVRSVGDLLNARMEESRTVDASGWIQLLEPLGVIEIDNPDRVSAAGSLSSGVVDEPEGEPAQEAAEEAERGGEPADGDEQGDVVEAERTVYERGPLPLSGDQVGDFLGARNDDENDLNRMVRIERFWAAWLTAIAGADGADDIVPGEVEAGLGRFVRALASAQVEIVTLPAATVRLPGHDGVIYVVDEALVDALVARVIPFPLGSPPGQRTSVRLLDGTGELDNGLRVVRPLVEAGAEIEVLGNAVSFDYLTTELIVGTEGREAAEVLRAALGAGEILETAEVGDAVQVTIVLGRDVLALASDGAVTGTVRSSGVPDAAPDDDEVPGE